MCQRGGEGEGVGTSARPVVFMQQDDCGMIADRGSEVRQRMATLEPKGAGPGSIALAAACSPCSQYYLSGYYYLLYRSHAPCPSWPAGIERCVSRYRVTSWGTDVDMPNLQLKRHGFVFTPAMP